MQKYTHPFKRRLRTASLALTGALALGSMSGCVAHIPEKPTRATPFSTSTYPTLSPEQKNANNALTTTALQVVDKIADNAKNPKSCVKATGTYDVGNWPAMQANNGKLVDSLLPQIVFEYQPGNNIIMVQSQDLFFSSNDAITSGIFNGIEMQFSLPEPTSDSTSKLNTAIQTTGQLQIPDFQHALDGKDVNLYSVTLQHGNDTDYTKDMLQQLPDLTYQLSHEVASVNTQSTQKVASPADMTVFSDAMLMVQNTLSQGVNNIQCPATT